MLACHVQSVIDIIANIIRGEKINQICRNRCRSSHFDFSLFYSNHINNNKNDFFGFVGIVNAVYC